MLPSRLQELDRPGHRRYTWTDVHDRLDGDFRGVTVPGRALLLRDTTPDAWGRSVAADNPDAALSGFAHRAGRAGDRIGAPGGEGRGTRPVVPAPTWPGLDEMSCWYGSYVDLADKTLRELFPRLIFSVGDTDDHLRHHPPLRDGQARPEPATHAVGITRDGQL